MRYRIGMARRSLMPPKLAAWFLAVVLLLFVVHLVLPENRFAGSNLIAMVGLVLQAIVLAMVLREQRT